MSEDRLGKCWGGGSEAMEVLLIIDALSGELLLESPDRIPADIIREVAALAGAGQEFGCARPVAVQPPPAATLAERAAGTCVRIAGFYHNSLVEGPGRRSSVLFQSCPLACKGCWVPELHSPDGGSLVPVECLADALLDPTFERDGVSILGGEPFAQPEALLALVRTLRAHGCEHVLCYSGYTYEALLERAACQPEIGAVLDDLDILVDGPYVEALADSAGEWTGSGNQRVIDLRATRQSGQVVLY